MSAGPRAWIWAAAVAFLGEAFVAPAIDFAGIAPDFAAIGTVLLALSRGAASATLGGFALGLILDLANPPLLGLHALALALVGYGCGQLRDRLVYSLTAVVSVLVGLAALVHGTIVLLIDGHFGRPAPFLLQVLPAALYSGLVGFPLLRLAERLGIFAQDD